MVPFLDDSYGRGSLRILRPHMTFQPSVFRIDLLSIWRSRFPAYMFLQMNTRIPLKAYDVITIQWATFRFSTASNDSQASLHKRGVTAYFPISLYSFLRETHSTGLTNIAPFEKKEKMESEALRMRHGTESMFPILIHSRDGMLVHKPIIGGFWPAF